MKRLLGMINYFHQKLLMRGSSEKRVAYLRRRGVKNGEKSRIGTLAFSTEPYLIQIGSHVGITAGKQFITHDGSVMCFQGEIEGGIFGKIKIGDNVFVGMNCVILRYYHR